MIDPRKYLRRASSTVSGMQQCDSVSGSCVRNEEGCDAEASTIDGAGGRETRANHTRQYHVMARNPSTCTLMLEHFKVSDSQANGERIQFEGRPGDRSFTPVLEKLAYHRHNLVIAARRQEFK